MSYKGNHYQVPSTIHFIEELKDHLLACGWTLEAPSDSLANRQAQDDEHAHILGWFLHSTGESGNDDIYLHLHHGLHGDSYRAPGDEFSYLTTGVSDVDTTFSLQSGEGANWASGDIFKIGDELVQVGAVSVDDLTGCTRGVNSTTAASHTAGDVLAKQSSSSIPMMTLYAFRDMSIPIAQSSSPENMGQEAALSPFAGLTGYSANVFRYGSLIKVRDPGGAEDDKMRWITSDPGDGTFEYQRFKNSPGSANVDIVSAGFFPHASRKQIVGTYSKYKSPTFPGFDFGVQTRDVWIYASKDGFAVVVLDGSNYRAYYGGSYIPLNSPLTTVAESTAGGDIAAGSQTIAVADTDLFTPDGVYRILGQSANDWVDNWDQSGSTYMGATGAGEWDDLDCDEIAYECVIVQSVDDVAGTVTFTAPMNYSYRQGAVIGEDPRPRVGPVRGGQTSANQQFDNDYDSGQSAAVFHAVKEPGFLTSYPAHRRRDRCTNGDGDFGGTANPWDGDGGRDYWGILDPVMRYMRLSYNTSVENDQEGYGSRLPLLPFSLTWYYAGREAYGAFSRIYGIIPFVREMRNSLGGASEDTLRVMWNGKHETFRVFQIAGYGAWVAVGPEIWP